MSDLVRVCPKRENEREKRGPEGGGRDNFTDSSDKMANVLGHIKNVAFTSTRKIGHKSTIATHTTRSYAQFFMPYAPYAKKTA